MFPLYDAVKADHVVPGMRALLKQLHSEIDALEASGEGGFEGLLVLPALLACLLSVVGLAWVSSASLFDRLSPQPWTYTYRPNPSHSLTQCTSSPLLPDIHHPHTSVEPTWEGLVQPLEKLTDKHSRAWGVVTHLKV